MEYNKKLDELWKIIQSCESKEERERIVSKLDQKVLTDLRSRHNPYKKPVYGSDKGDRYLAMQYTNYTDIYARRFAMTSLIGFVYRMLDEWKSSRDLPSEYEGEFAKLYGKKMKEVCKSKSIEQLMARVADGDKRAAVSLAKLQKQYDTTELNVLLEDSRTLRTRIDNNKLAADKAVAQRESIVGDDEKSGKLRELRTKEYEIFNEKVVTDTAAEFEVNAKIAKLRAAISTYDVQIRAGPDAPLEEFEPDEETIDSVNTEIKKELGIAETLEEVTEHEQDIIEEFLNSMFKFNPDEHVRAAYKPNYTAADAKNSEKSAETAAARTILPPADTFFRLNRYLENHFEELRQATDDIYNEKSDFEVAFAPLEMFTDVSKFDEWKRRYADEFEGEPMLIKFNVWNLIGPFSQNREKRDFYNKNTEIIKAILEQSEKDVKAGRELMQHNVKKAKKKNIKKEGPDAPSFAQYKEAHPSDLAKLGAIKVDTDVPITAEEVPKDSDEANREEVEVNVHVIEPTRRGKRLTTKLKQWKFNIPAEKTDPNSVKGFTPSEAKGTIAP